MNSGRHQARCLKYSFHYLLSLISVLTCRFFSGFCFHCHPHRVQCDLSISNLICFSLYPQPRTPLYSVLLWACASALQTLRSLSGLILPSSNNPFSPDPFASSQPFLFLLDLFLLFTTLLSFFKDLFYCSSVLL